MATPVGVESSVAGAWGEAGCEGRVGKGHKFHGCRSRYRKSSVLRLYGPASGRYRRAMDLLNAKQVQTVGRADDIYDGIDGADLVEVDLIYLDAVDSGLRPGQVGGISWSPFLSQRGRGGFRLSVKGYH